MTAKQVLKEAGLAKSHWGKRIIDAEERGEFTQQDRIEAENWVTCACGKVTVDIPRHDVGSPIDTKLLWLGLDFDHAVDSHRFTSASKTLVEIEKRAAQVTKSVK